MRSSNAERSSQQDIAATPLLYPNLSQDSSISNVRQTTENKNDQAVLLTPLVLNDIGQLQVEDDSSNSAVSPALLRAQEILKSQHEQFIQALNNLRGAQQASFYKQYSQMHATLRSVFHYSYNPQYFVKETNIFSRAIQAGVFLQNILLKLQKKSANNNAKSLCHYAQVLYSARLVLTAPTKENIDHFKKSADHRIVFDQPQPRYEKMPSVHVNRALLGAVLQVAGAVLAAFTFTLGLALAVSSGGLIPGACLAIFGVFAGFGIIALGDSYKMQSDVMNNYLKTQHSADRSVQEMNKLRGLSM